MTTATATTPAAAPPADGTTLPDVSADARVLAAQATVGRLAGEVSRLERELAAQEDIRRESQAAEQDVARRLVAGESLAQVRIRPTDGVVTRLRTDLRHAEKGLALARSELAQVERDVARELAVQFAPTFRARVRPAAEAFIRFLRAMDEYQGFIADLRGAGLLVGPCSHILAGAASEDPLAWDGQLPYRLRELIDAGVLDERRDAELLAGLHVTPPYVPPPPPPPPAPRKTDGAFRKMLRGLGVAGLGSDD